MQRSHSEGTEITPFGIGYHEQLTKRNMTSLHAGLFVRPRAISCHKCLVVKAEKHWLTIGHLSAETTDLPHLTTKQLTISATSKVAASTGEQRLWAQQGRNFSVVH